MNDSNYIPKSKRCKPIEKGKDLMRKMIRKINYVIQNTTRNWKNTKRLRKMRVTIKCSKPKWKKSYLITREKSNHRKMSMALSALAMQANMIKYHSARTVKLDTDSYEIGVDNRCSGCISHRSEDFIGPFRDTTKAIKGFGGSKTQNVKIGTIQWSWMDDNGKSHQFTIPNSYYVPEGKVRLLSPQHWAKSVTGNNRNRIKGTGCETLGDTVTLFWSDKRYKLTVPLCRKTNVATISSTPGYSRFKIFCQQAEIDYEDTIKDPIIAEPSEAATDGDNHYVPNKNDRYESDDRIWLEDKSNKYFDLQAKKKAKEDFTHTEIEQHQRTLASEFLSIHQRCGHIGFDKLKEMSKQGIIHRKFRNAPTPVCTACMHAKATKRKWRDKKKKSYQNLHATIPGQRISVDQLVSPTPGLIAQISGILTTKRYNYATVYVDQATSLGYVHLQKTASVEETLQSKKAFETFAMQRGIRVQACHADNGIFRANKWVNDCMDNNQPLTFAAVGAHHQNGFAERRIRTIQELARSMLIHAAERWPQAITLHLWPYAIQTANTMVNETPNMTSSSRLCPEQMFSQSVVSPNQKHWHTFGCPVYVLDSALQTGNIFHKWKSRSKVGIYLGRSPNHARNVALVLDRTTGLVSPQFHVQFDSNFDTVKPDKFDHIWKLKAGFITSLKRKLINSPSRGRNNDNYNNSISTNETRRRENALRDERAQRRSERNNRKRNNEGELISHSEGGHMYTNIPLSEGDRNSNSSPSEGGIISSSEGDTNKIQQSKIQIPNENSQTSSSLPIEDMELVHKLHHTPERHDDTHPHIIAAQNIIDETNEIYAHYHLCHNQEQMNTASLMAFKAVADPDSMYMHQAMKQHDRKHFIKAMESEVQAQYNNKNFSLIKRKDIPKGKSILPTVWQMKRKRDIKTQKIKKYKARLCLDGSRMKKNIDYSETYAPVASWRSIRIVLSLVAKFGWHTRQLDFVLAFPQAPVERELYMEVPKGFDVEGGDRSEYALKLHRNIYGQKQAGRVWNQYLAKKLTEEVGFTQSKIDECLFYRGNVIYCLYTDDSILAGPSEQEIENAIKDIKKANLDITEEGTIEDFLGVNIERKTDGTIHLTQPHLINQILKDLKLDHENVKVKATPSASSKLISHHSDSEAFDESFHYRSIIGKLNFLEKSTRPDISYTVHQCARFCENPRRQHGDAIRWLARYLKGTKDQGIILRPELDKDLQVYVDADFAGNWDPKESHRRDTARSRHGYVIKYCNCPIMWKSQLQTEICLSSTESEYTGLSYALREVIPIMESLKELSTFGVDIPKSNSEIYCTVFEDNSGAIEMATHHKYRPRTKHLNVKLHHFRDYVSRGEVIVKPISTKYQPADLLTKGLNEEGTTRHRKTIMGW